MDRKSLRRFLDLMFWPELHRIVLSIQRFGTNILKNGMAASTPRLRDFSIALSGKLAQRSEPRRGANEAHFVIVLQASLRECRHSLILSKELGYVDDQFTISHIKKIRKLLDSYTSQEISNSRGQTRA